MQRTWRTVIFTLVLTFCVSEVRAQSFCVTCLKLRVGRPFIVRGPSDTIPDNPFNEIKLNNGQYRGFSGNVTTYKMDGPDPWSMGGPATAVLGQGSGYPDKCGRWINSTFKVGSTTRGLVDNEFANNCTTEKHHGSMSYATSSDEGTSWTVQGVILDYGSQDPLQNTGEGGCTMIDGSDGYYYAYCLHLPEWTHLVARAPASNLMPGNWVKWYNGAWSTPGVGGVSTDIGYFGMSASVWDTNNNVMLLVEDGWFHGLRMSFSSNKTAFTSVQEPLVYLDAVDWNRPASTELYGYSQAINYAGGVRWTTAFQLTHLYLQPNPNEGLDKRYLVFRDVSVTLMPSAQVPQVGVALARWHNTALKDRWSTTAPVPGNFNSYAFEGTFGYLMTKPHPSLPTKKIMDCVSNWPGHPDHLPLDIQNTTCENTSTYKTLRTLGWIYSSSQPNTVPLYRCYSSTEQSHFASNQSNCEGLGTMEWLMGYALAN